MEQLSVMVSIRCLAYNHEPYIRQCLEGFVMQQTNFRFEAIVHDDASTDGTADIIREYAEKYPDIIKPIFETENQYSKHDGSLRRIMDAAINATGAKYIAICEGDDYWTDPLKLQKQVDYLEGHEECVMCVNDTLFDCNGKLKKVGFQCPYDYECDLTIEEVILCGGGYICTASIVYRRGLLEKKSECKWWQIANVGDYPLQIAGTLFGKLHYFPDVMCVYRYRREGAWTSAHKNYDVEMYKREKKWLMALNTYTRKKYYEPISSYLFKKCRQMYLQNDLSNWKYLSFAKCYGMRKLKRAIKDIITRCNQ